jgi:death on curing protein
MSWRWVRKRALVQLHDISLAQHGGLSGIRDEGLLESALARPENFAVDEQPDVAELAACYAVGLAKNHPFADGNKRAAFLALGLFLRLNGYRLVAAQPDATVTMLAVAAGEIDQAQLVQWIRANMAKETK